MDFDDTPEDARFRAEARAWLQENAAPREGPDDWNQAYSDGRLPEADYVKHCQEWQDTLAQAGWACITWPVEFGGRGGTSRQAAIFAQEQAAFGVSNGVFAVGIGMAGPTIIAHGDEEQKRRYLPELLHGREVWCQLFSEPGAGSDLAGLSTRAEQDGDEYVVNGQKVWTSGAQFSDWGILLARTDVDVPKHRGISYFLVDMHSPGIEVRPLKQMTGASHFNEVFMTDLRIPVANVLGGVNAGWGVAMTTLANERALIGGGSSGSDFEGLVDIARQRGLATDPVLRQRLADFFIRREILRYLSMRVQTAAARGEAPGPEANVIKLFMAGHLKQTSDLALAVQGPTGALLHQDAYGGGAWQQSFLSAPSIRIAGGSDEVQRNIIGERALGLPGDIRVDKNVSFRELTTRRTTAD